MHALQTSAYNCWKARFDTAVTSAPTAIGTQLLRNSLPLYAIAHCTLAIDVDELQIFAGKRRSLGLPVVRLVKLSGVTIQADLSLQPPASVDATKRRVIAWSGGRGKEAAWHAAHFVRSTLLTRRGPDGGAVQSMFSSWCVYIACLCLHAYCTASLLASRGSIHNEGSADPLPLLEAVSLPIKSNETWLRCIDLQICAPSPEEIDYTSLGPSMGLCEMISQLLLQDDSGWELIEEASRLLAWVGAGGDDP